MSYQSYRDLKIYQLAHKLAVEIHEMSLTLPKFELYEEGAQIRRSSKSVKTNIVEGYGRRRYKADFIKFLTYALASCDETRDHLDTLYDTKSLKDKKFYEYLRNEYDILGRKIRTFMKSVESGHKPVKKM
ncbi:four helix bundle protein [bacterium]|nr:four helix bundle protein [bacterium]